MCLTFFIIISCNNYYNISYNVTVGYICSTLAPNLKFNTNLNRVLHIYLVNNSNIYERF